MIVDNTVHQQYICMPYTAYKQDPKTFKIMPRRKAIEYLNIAIIAWGSREVKDPERLFEAITFKSHVLKFYAVKLISKSYQNYRDNRNQIHPYQEETDSLPDPYPGICVPDKSNQQNNSKNFKYAP